MGSTCSGWRGESRTLRFLNRFWRIGICPTSACLCLSLSLHLSCGGCCPRNMLVYQQRKLPMKRGRWRCRWTGKTGRSMLVNKGDEMQVLSGVVREFNTHLPEVWTGPNPCIAVYSLKYCGIEKPRKIEKPRMNFVRKLLRLQNWRKLTPAAPVLIFCSWN